MKTDTVRHLVCWHIGTYFWIQKKHLVLINKDVTYVQCLNIV